MPNEVPFLAVTNDQLSTVSVSYRPMVPSIQIHGQGDISAQLCSLAPDGSLDSFQEMPRTSLCSILARLIVVCSTRAYPPARTMAEASKPERGSR